MGPRQPDVALPEHLEVRRQLGTAGEAEESGRSSLRQAERTAATGVEQAPVLFELPELHAESPTVVHGPDQLADHDSIVA